MDAAEQSQALRDNETTAARTAEARMSVDPGFVHHRLIQNLIGVEAMMVVNDLLRQIPPHGPAAIQQLQTDHIYVDAAVRMCSILEVPSLSRMLSEGGDLFASVETVLACPAVYEQERANVTLVPKGIQDWNVSMEFSTSRIKSDTTRMELARGGALAIIGRLRHRDAAKQSLQIEPLVIGGPSLESSSPELSISAPWLSYSFGEIFIDDIDEFSLVKSEPKPDDLEPMRTITERAFKQCLAEVLGQEAPKDWGGEQSDFFSGHLHLTGRRVAGAFLLKGPSDFRPMQPSHLGKNADQIARLAQEPADLLVVQHSHEIGSAVRSTIRAFANELGTVRRRYCLIDGYDSLRFLAAYDKLDHAKQLSETERTTNRARRQTS